MDVLEDIGLVTDDGKINHQYFQPRRHMPPCSFNAKCNMSPVISDYFVALRSMQNAQAFDHKNGLAKYVAKYISKFDEKQLHNMMSG